jgi:hypothetical protein
MRESHSPSSASSIFHYSGDVASPSARSIWDTDRRLAERSVPGAPKKNRRASLPFYQCEPIQPPPSEPEHLLLPANTIHEEDEDDDFCVLSMRPEKMFAQDDCFQSARLEQRDPTTVLLLPDMHSSLRDEMEEEEEEDQDVSLSPRLFRFGYGNLSRYEVMDASTEDYDDESDDIFRPTDDEMEGRESLLPRRFSWTTELRTTADSEHV